MTYLIPTFRVGKRLYSADVDLSALLRNDLSTARQAEARNDFSTPSVITLRAMLKANYMRGEGGLGDLLMQKLEGPYPLRTGTSIRKVNGNYIVSHRDDAVGTKIGTQVLVRPSNAMMEQLVKRHPGFIATDYEAFAYAINDDRDSFLYLREPVKVYLEMPSVNHEEGVVVLRKEFMGHITMAIEPADTVARSLPTAFTYQGEAPSKRDARRVYEFDGGLI